MNYVLAMTLRNSSRKMPLNQINSRVTKDKNGRKSYCDGIFSFPDKLGSKVTENVAAE